MPLLATDAFGFFKAEGLSVELARTPSWALVRDKLVSGEYDASQLVLPMPFAMSLGIGSTPQPMRVAAIDNIHGNALVLHLTHRDRRDPKDWKGFKFGIPFEQSIHNLLLRFVLAEAGLDPDRDVEIRVYPPPDSVANLQSGSLDGMLFAEPWGQRAVFEGVGFYHTLSRDILPSHPCCSIAVTERFATATPNAYGALARAVIRSVEFVGRRENRQAVAEALAPARYLNQPRTILEQVLLGRYADGLGAVQEAPDRIDFKPFPSSGMGIWMLTQMRRWGYLKDEIDYEAVTERVFRTAEARAVLRDLNVVVGSDDLAPISVGGRSFDPRRAAEYQASFRSSAARSDSCATRDARSVPSGSGGLQKRRQCEVPRGRRVRARQEIHHGVVTCREARIGRAPKHEGVAPAAASMTRGDLRLRDRHL